jgi:hypothetical protein
MTAWQSPERSFTTLQATVRDWGRHGRISELQGLGGSGDGDVGEERLGRVAISADRKVYERWERGQFERDALEDATNWPLFDPSWLADHQPLNVLGEVVVSGRAGIALEAVGVDGPAGMLLPGANRCVGVFDQERAVLLRCEAWLDDELLMVEELTEVVFDEPLAPQVFAPS